MLLGSLLENSPKIDVINRIQEIIGEDAKDAGKSNKAHGLSLRQLRDLSL